MNREEAYRKLKRLGQEHLAITSCQMIAEIEAIDEALLQQQQAHLVAPLPNDPMRPLEKVDPLLETKHKKLGDQAMAEGAVAAVVAAGGQGTRLGFDGPKGAYSLLGKSLYQRLAEKTLAAGDKLYLAIMPSPATDEMTRAHFQENKNFGLSEEQLIFFQQSTLPLLDDRGKLFLSAEGKIATGPNGNGYALHEIVKQGIADLWRKKGVRCVTFVPVDNALSQPFDPQWIGYHLQSHADVTTLAAFRTDPDEKVGVFGMRDEKVVVAEYSELTPTQKTERLDNGSLCFSCANLSLFCFSMDFIDRVASQELSLHFAHKPASHLVKGTIQAWKSEYFIFDVLSYSHKTHVLVAPRERCFAPLKNATGPDSPETVIAQLQR